MMLAMAGALAGCSAQDRFDLQCRVREMEWDQGQPGLSQDYTIKYRIDLGRKKWCADECENWTGLEVDGQTLTTWDTDVESPAHDGVMVRQRIRQTIDRKTGRLTSVIYMRTRPGSFDGVRDRVMTIEGECARAPFKPADHLLR